MPRDIKLSDSFKDIKYNHVFPAIMENVVNALEIILKIWVNIDQLYHLKILKASCSRTLMSELHLKCYSEMLKIPNFTSGCNNYAHIETYLKLVWKQKRCVTKEKF